MKIEDVLGSKIETALVCVTSHPQSGVPILEIEKLILSDGSEFRVQGHYYGGYLPIEPSRMKSGALIESARENEIEEELLDLLEQ